MLEEELKNRIATRYFKKFDCDGIIKRIDFSVKCTDARKSVSNEYVLWAEAKQQPTDTYRMLTQLLLTIKQDVFDLQPPKFLGCFDNEKISFIEYYDALPVFGINDFNWVQTPSVVDDKTVETVRKTIDKNKIFTFFYEKDDTELRNFITKNFKGNGSLLSMLINKNNFTFVYQKWSKAVMPYIDAPWETLKKEYSIYSRDFFLADLNVDDRGTTDISDDKPAYEDFYITFDASQYKPYELHRKDGLGLDTKYEFGFKDDGKERYAEFWKLYKRPPKEEIWKYIISRLDLLVPQDVRERKGAFFTPQIWVEKSQQYIADVLGENWQDEYYVWDCCAGTGNLLNGLTNKYHIFASTLDQQDVDVMKERIKNGANLLESHIFQFDFLNDDFSKCPQSLQEIINDPEKRKKLVIYINPPYAEAATTRTKTNTGSNKADVATSNKTSQKYKESIGAAANEIFALFLIRAQKELQRCKIANFATLKALCAPNFAKFRNLYQAKLEKSFIVPADTFDNVRGQFPIGFYIWDCNEPEIFKETITDVLDTDGLPIGIKHIYAPVEKHLLMDWLKTIHDKNGTRIAYLRTLGSDIQNNGGVFITLMPSKADIEQRKTCDITKQNMLSIAVYFAVRLCIPATWLNDRDQFLYPNDGWKTDLEFQTNCLVYTLFHGQNRISSSQGVNHWIPFSEEEVNAKEMFNSHFMKDFFDGKIKAEKSEEPNLFSSSTAVESGYTLSLQITETAQSVMNAGRELWQYYHSKPDANPNASLYDIKEYFQGRNDKGKMNASSADPVYTQLMDNLKLALRTLSEKIKPKVYEYGFLK
jgi:hypothetical protein